DLVLHVRDISAADSDAEARDVEQVLEQISPPEGRRQPMIEVWNKIDLVPDEDMALLRARAARSAETGGPLAVAVSAVTGEGIEALRETIASLVDSAPEVETRLPPGDGEALAWLYQNGRVTARSDQEDGSVRLLVRLDDQALGRFERLFPE